MGDRCCPCCHLNVTAENPPAGTPIVEGGPRPGCATCMGGIPTHVPMDVLDNASYLEVASRDLPPTPRVRASPRFIRGDGAPILSRRGCKGIRTPFANMQLHARTPQRDQLRRERRGDVVCRFLAPLLPCSLAPLLACLRTLRPLVYCVFVYMTGARHSKCDTPSAVCARGGGGIIANALGPV